MHHTFYFFGWFYSLTIDPLLRKIRERIYRYAHSQDLYPIIDLCCGTGAQCRVLSASPGLVFGLDLDFKMLFYASSKSPHIPYICADVHSIPLKKNSLKGLVLSFSLHEKPPKLRHKMISEARKFLIPGGKIIFLDYDPPWNFNSRLALLSYITLIERGGGSQHYSYFQNFMADGGLTRFIKQENILIIDQHDVEWASSRIILTEPV